MKRLLFLCFVIISHFSFSHQYTELRNELSKSSIKFSSKLYKEVSKRHMSNFLVSPLSLKIALGIIAPAAKGKTHKEIIRALHVKNELEIVGLIQNISSSAVGKNASLISANKIYISDIYKLNPNYMVNVKENFKSQIQTISFTNSKEASEEINKWVEKKTKRKIKDIVSPDELDSRTVLVLLNALYFHDKWLHPFNKSSTEKKPFFLNSTTSINVDMMEVKLKQTARGYNTQLKANIVKLPYISEDTAMYLVVAESIDGISNLEIHIKDILSTEVNTTKYVKICMPKFAINSSIDLIPILEKMGMQRSLGKNPDFSGMLDPENKLLQISLIKQSAMVEVDEKGTVASVSTKFEKTPRVVPRYFTLVADRPFIFFIKHKSEILFIGRFSSP